MIRSIKELKNIHFGEDIYIILSGPSCNYINADFFNNKITIGVNQVYKKYYCDYLVRKENSHLRDSISTGSKVIVSEWDSGNIIRGKRLKNTIGNEKLDFYVFEHLENNLTKIDFSVLGTDKLVVSFSTVTSAIHMAAYMGAKNILLVGHDCGLLDDKFVFDGYYDSITETPWKNWDEYKKWLGEIEGQTIAVKKKISEYYKCNIYSINPFINFNLEGHKIK
jgi:hypothetical protein